MNDDYKFFMNIFFFVWPRCRMKCKYCLERNTNNYGDFDKKDIIKILQIFGHEKVKRVWLTGGEATTCPYILDYISICKENNIKPMFSTQDGKALKSLSKNLYDIDIQLSLNGLYDDHDEITQVKNSFYDIEDAVNEINIKCYNHDIRISARFILRPECASKVEDYVNWCINHNIKKIYFSNISSSGKGKEYIEKNGKIPRDKFSKLLTNVSKKYQGIVDIETKSNGKQGDLCGVYPNGDLYVRPVDSAENGNLLLGNLFKDNPKDMYKRFKDDYPDLCSNYIEKIKSDGTL